MFLDLEQINREGNTALLQALYFVRPCNLHETTAEVSFAQAELLVSRGSSTLASNHLGMNCLHKIPFELIERNCPHPMLKRLLQTMINAGADVCARDKHGQTPLDYVSAAGFERSWQEALTACRMVPSEVYFRSGQQWVPLPEYDKVTEISDLLYLFKPGCGWSRETLQTMLHSIVQTLDEAEMEEEAFAEITKIAVDGGSESEHAWREVLAACGHDPTVVYAESGEPWRELSRSPHPRLADMHPSALFGQYLVFYADEENPGEGEECDSGEQHRNDASVEHPPGSDVDPCVNEATYGSAENRNNDCEMQLSGNDPERASSDQDPSDEQPRTNSFVSASGPPAAAEDMMTSDARPLDFLEPHRDYQPVAWALPAVWDDGWRQDDTITSLPMQQDRMDYGPGFVKEMDAWNAAAE